MQLHWLDLSVFIVFFLVVITISMYKSRQERTGADFFLAGRGLTWPLIGFSMIAANISTEHFVGMSGQAAGVAGMAVASYEWIAAITMVFVAMFFLPKFLRSGIYTIPEFLEYRYNSAARGIMAFYMIMIYILVSIAAVVYTGALALHTIFDFDLVKSVWLIGIIAAIYTTWGGLKAVAWADLFQGSALIIGGLVTMVLGFKAVGGVGAFFATNQDKLHMIMPADHPVIPWTTLVIGLWIPNFYYWGLNQFITQRTLAAKSLKQGQMGIIFAAFLKLLIPFIIVIPGIIAFQLYKNQLLAPGHTPDQAYPLLIRNLVGPGMRGFILAALAGSVISTLGSLLNSVSTILTMDLYKRHLKKTANQETLIKIGRVATIGFVLAVCLLAPQLGDPKFKGIFNYIQEFQGFISPGVLAAFIFGLFVKRTPPAAGVSALVLSVPIYGFLKWQFGQVAFLNRMAINFLVLIAVMTIITLVKPLKEPKILPVQENFDSRPSPIIKYLGAVIIILTITLYIIFW
ncbi:MAG: solute:sodium symporter family transporter [Acidobacteriota bacterium]|nr:solute:sodium symporter family transporter [Acidobacteriota bacterium]MDW3229008.1 solute:sodium symporter family transporter [Acidobacteriota bacterium]MDY0231024.1 solute:sodium symporter family transporter [Candidatus Saccharicenans sp.]